MGEEGFKVFCVERDGSSGEKGASESMLEARKSLKADGFKPEWISQKDCLNVKLKIKNCVYLFDTFNGKAFNHIKSVGFRILGPLCILTSTKYKMDIPRRSSPVYNLAMKDVIVCCTNIDKSKREEIHEKVELMGGSVSKDFTEFVTHLIAGEVGSKKYQVAASMGKRIMLPKWVDDVWQATQIQHVSCTDEQFEDGVCPIFMGLVLTVSGLDTEERTQVKKLIESEGGKYSGEMKINECTHLVINKPKGAKYDFAKKWKINIVKSDWLYDSVEKGYCLDENKYRINDAVNDDKSQVKTSTPEKEGVATSRMSTIGDISCISGVSEVQLTHLNETSAATFQRKSLDDVESSVNAIDLTKQPADLFLDGCKIYLSGFKGPAMDKLRKVINAGGGTRLSQLNENVTHVVIGERMEKDIETLKTLSFRPHVVTATWLAECYRQGCTVEEEAFQSPELPPPEPESPKLKGKKKIIEKQPTQEAPVQRPSESAMDEFSDIMSQYLLQADQGISGSKEHTIVNNEPTVAAAAAAAAVTVEDEDDLTQDPANQSEVVDGKIFHKKVFMFFGFEEEPEKELSEYIIERGGKVLRQTSRVVPDYGIVPIDGFPVNRTVKEIVTNAWLQMCLEQDMLLDINSNELFSPLDILSDGLPLEGCVLSVSGYAGTERDCLMHIADILGAECQEYFVRKASKGLKASTHLIVKEADGSKYHAAKKWGIPTVSNRWLFACARTGRREDEKKYSVDSEEQISDSKQPVVEQNKASVNNKNTEAMNDPSSMAPGDYFEKDKSLDHPTNDQGLKQADENDTTVELNNKHDVSIKDVPHDGSSRDRGDQDVTIPMDTGVDQSNCDEDVNELDMDESPDGITEGGEPHTGTPCQESHVESNVNQSEANSSGQKPFTESQKENLEQGKSTPKLQNHRVKELQNDELPTPKNSSRKSIVNSPSPGRFLDPSKEFKPRFDLDDVMKALESPAGQAANQRKTGKRKSSLPLEELFSHHLAAAAKYTENYTTGESDEVDGDQFTYQEQKGPLKDIIIAVSKKLSSQQAEMNNIVDSLGGDYRWQYDTSCTHFIFQGRTNDTSKEFKTARDQKKFIVSPHWLYMCKEQNARVDETLFPHNYNPNLTLSVVSSRRSGTPARGTPARGTRKSARTVSTTSVKPVKLEIKESDSKQRSEVTEPSVVQKSDDVEMKNDEKEVQQKEQDVATVEEPESTELAGTIDIREEFTKQLETMMAASKSKKSTKRRSKRLNLSGHNSTSGESPGEVHNGSSNHSRSGSRSNRWMLDDEDKNAKGSTRTDGKGSDSNSLPEASQSVQVMWDDPTGRMEQEKLAHKLERACSPTQDMMKCELLDAQFSDVEDEVMEDAGPDSSRSKTEQENEEARVPTPEAPPLAFPVAGKSNISNAELVAVNDPIEEDEEEQDQNKPPPVFIFSGMSQEEKDHYGELVESLGGRVLDGLHYEPSCTHLVIGTPSRNEKFLACVASGKWVLHKSYLEACREEAKFVQEDLYEWGGEGTAGLMQKMSSQVKKLAQAACRWRLSVLYQNSQSAVPCQGAFSGWRVILSTDKNKEGNFRRLLEAGGATVLNIKPPFTDMVKASHAFVELNKVPLSEDDLKSLVVSKVTCVKPDFIAAHLTEDPPPSAEDFYPTEVKTLVASLFGAPSSKRKTTLSTSDEKANKRLRKK